jgi:formaldehyde-activating enzyme involved in methanogenesis
MTPLMAESYSSEGIQETILPLRQDDSLVISINNFLHNDIGNNYEKRP